MTEEVGQHHNLESILVFNLRAGQC